MSVTIISARPTLNIIRTDGRIRVNAGGPGLRGLPGGPGANGIFAGSESDTLVKSTDKSAVMSGATPFLAQARKAAPWTLFNSLEDGGRFGGKENNTGSVASAAFDGGTFIVPYNGSSKASGGQYTYNSSTFGGAGAAVNTDIQDLLTAAGLASTNSKAYQLSFNILQLTAGAGTAVQQAGSSPARYMSSIAMGGFSQRRLTLGMWVKCASGLIGFQRPGSQTSYEAASDLLVNGVVQGATANTLAPADGWKQVTFVRDVAVNATSDNVSQAPYFGQIYAEPGSVYLIALPWLFFGLFFPHPTELPFIVHSLAARRI